MATMEKMLAVAPLSEGEVVQAITTRATFEIEVMDYAKNKGVSIDSELADHLWTITLNGFNVTTFNLTGLHPKHNLTTMVKQVKDMINILASKPSAPKVGTMASKMANEFKKFSYVGMWETGHPGVQIGAKWFERVINIGFGQTRVERFYLQGYFVNGQYVKDYARAVRTADYYQEYSK